MADEALLIRNDAAADLDSLARAVRHWMARASLWSVAAIALSTLLGWTLDLPRLTNWGPGFATQKPLAALAFLALAVALLPFGAGRSTWRSWLGWAVIAIAAVSLAQNLADVDAWRATSVASPGPGPIYWRMDSATARMLMFAGAAVGLLQRNRHAWVVPALAIMIGLIGAFELVLLLAGNDLHVRSAFGSVALPTAVTSLLLATGLLMRRPLDLADLARQLGFNLGIRAWLITFGVMAALPVLLFAGLAAERVANAERMATMVQLNHRTEAATNKVERYLQSLWDLAVTLAEAPSLQTGDLPAFYGFAKRAMDAGKVGRSVVLVDPTGQMLLNTRRPFGSELPIAGDIETLNEAVVSKVPRISGLFQGAVSRGLIFVVWVPVVRDDHVRWLVGVTVALQDLTAALHEERLPEGWVGAVIDRQGIIVARTQETEQFVGRSASSELRASIAKRQWGIFPSVTATGIAVSTSIRNLPNSGWTMAVGVPQSLFNAPADASRRFMFGLGLAALLTASFLAFVLGRHMSQHIANVAAAAVAVGEGRHSPMMSSSVREIDAVSNALVAARGLIHQRDVALRESEADFRGFFENINMGTAQIDSGGRFRRVNKRYCEITGYSQEELIAGMGPLDLDHPEDRALDRERLQRFFQGETEDYETEKRYVHKDGHLVWVRVTAKLVANERDGGRRYTAGVIEDITERKLAEMQLLEARRLTAVACEAGRMGTWHLDIKTNRLDYSDEALALIGIRREDWKRTPEGLEAFIHPNDIKNRRRYRAEALASGDHLEHDFRIRRPDGTEHWLHSRGNIARDADGKAIASVGVMLDITERKHAEEHRELLIRELDHRVKNILALVETIVLRSREGASTMDEYIEALLGRLEALAQAHSAMSQGGWVGGNLGTLVHQELKPYATAANATIDGPKTVLTPLATQSLVLVLHELATNAAKYGGFSRSVANGHVSVSWQIHAEVHAGARPHLAIDWQEHSSPVSVPKRDVTYQGGYGSSVIRELVPYELPGSIVDYDFGPAGVRCHIELPLAVAVVSNA